jgi:hypothetical protein
MKRQGLRLAPLLALLAVAFPAIPQDRHPHLRAAIRELRAVREEMRNSPDDLCGHRAAAIRSAELALRQLQQADECLR